MDQPWEKTVRHSKIISKQLKLEWFIDREVLTYEISSLVLESKWKFGLKAQMKIDNTFVYFGLKADSLHKQNAILKSRFVLKSNSENDRDLDRKFENKGWQKLETYNWYEYVCEAATLKQEPYNYNGQLLIIFEIDIKLFEEEILADTYVPFLGDQHKVNIDRYKSLLESGKYSDVQFKVKDQLFPAHKYILASNSEFFDIMFENKFKEAHEPVIELKNIEPRVFKQILSYIYTNQLSADSIDIVDQLLIAADKYCLVDLIKSCELQLCAQISLSNYVDYLIVADICSRELLRQTVTYFIENNLDEVIKSELWTEFEKENVNLAYRTLKNISEKT